MKKSSVAILGLLIGTNGLQLQDISANQRKLFAANQKVYGGEVQIFDENYADDPEYEMNRVDLRLIKTAEDLRLHSELTKSSLDDPVSDKTMSVVTANSAKENKNSDWLAQKPESQSNLQLSYENDYENDRLYDFEESELIQQVQEIHTKQNDVITQEELDRDQLATQISSMSDGELAIQEKNEDKLQSQKEARLLKQHYKEASAKRADKYTEDPEHLADLQIESFGGY